MRARRRRHLHRPLAAGSALTLVVAALSTVGTQGMSPNPAGATTGRDVVTVSGGEVVDAGGYRYHAFFHDPLDTFQGHPGGNGCSSGCGGTNHGGGGGGGYGSPGVAGTTTAGGDGGDGFRADLLPIEVRDELADAGHEVGEVIEVDGLDRVWFAGGGGGGTFHQPSGSNAGGGTPGEGGRGGGGDGAAGDPGGISEGGHALANTGGGGGGSGSARLDNTPAAGAPEGKGRGGDGGSGVVIVRWPRVQAPDLAPVGAIMHDHSTHRYAIFLHSAVDGDRSTFTLTNPMDLDVEYLVVGGGGGGGGETYDDYGSGGGGAGGVVSTLGRPVVLSAGEHTVEVGAGGQGGDGVAAANQVGEVGDDGQPSILGDLAHARGGGGGAARRLPAGSGASGGGGTSQSAGTPGVGAPGVTSAALEVSGGNIDADVLVIAGGGSGGAGAAGGGGAGGVEWNFPADGDEVDADGARFAPLTLSGTYAVEVGAGAPPVTSPDRAALYSVGRNGSDSSFAAGPDALAASILAQGGGGGGRRPDVSSADDGKDPHGRDGGSGGGAGRPATSSAALGTAGEGSSTLGNDGSGGRGGSSRRAGGGGGAGSAGGASTRAGANASTGGDGTPLFHAFLAPFEIGEVHEDVRYVAAGGGGLVGFGGYGGGGDGTSAAAPTSAASGAPNTGSGGGALGAFTRSSGAGGSGVVIVRYAIPVWQQESDLGRIRIGDPLVAGALVGDPDDDVTAPLELVDGTLPPGVSIDAGSGQLVGLAAEEGAWTFTLRAFDRPGSDPGIAVDRTFTVEVFDALIVDEPFDDMPTSGWVLSGGGGWTPTVENETFGGESRGALRVTPALTSRAGFALYDVPQQARAGLDVTFWASVWQDSSTVGADGLVFFLKRGDDQGTDPGAFGSRLGYGTGGSTPGISGALLGIGLDTFGGYRRFSINGNTEPFTCPTIDEVGQTGSGTTSSPNNLSVRGPGQGLDGYCLLAPSVTISPGWGRSGTVAAGGTRTREAGARQVRVRYDYDPGDGGATEPSGTVRVWVDDVADGDAPKITLDAPQELLDAETFKFGFSGATGGSVNNQEVWDVVVRSVDPLSPITWIEDQLEPARVGDAYGADLDAKAVGGVRPFAFTVSGGALPPGLSLNSPLGGTPTTPGTYTFDITATSARGGTSSTETFTLVVEDLQTLELAVDDQAISSAAVTVSPSSVSATSGAATGLTVDVESVSPATCTVAGTEVTLVAPGTCTLRLTQAGGTAGGSTFAPADPTDISFEILDVDLRLAALTVTPGTLDPAFDPDRLEYQVSVSHGRSTVTVSASPADPDAVMSVGGAPLAAGATSQPLPLDVGTNSIELTVTLAGVSSTTTITVTRAAAPPPLPPAPVSQPGGAVPVPGPAPSGTVGGVAVPVTAAPAGPSVTEDGVTVSSGVTLSAGTVAVGLDLTDAGTVRSTLTGGTTDVSVARDAVASTSGSGLLPDTTVAVWLPRDGGDVRRVTTLSVEPDGTFTGTLPFDGSGDADTDGRPLPIGRQVLQLVGIDTDGQLTVIEQTVTILQPDPTPEPDRSAGAPPALTPGRSVATNAGLPETVTVTPLPDVRQARVTSDDGTWAMAVDIPSADGRVAPSDDGGALIELVADDVAAVSGEGFMPGTRADVWLFSTPTLLGSVTIDDDGQFTGQVDIDGQTITVGEHTLQLAGVGTDGYVRATNLGVLVTPPAAATPAPEAEPAPAPQPQPEAQPEPEVEAEPEAEAEATPEPAPALARRPAPTPAPAPEPEPSPAPEPAPAPQPQPQPEPAPAPQPEPEPEPEPDRVEVIVAADATGGTLRTILLTLAAAALAVGAGSLANAQRRRRVGSTSGTARS